MDGLDSFQGERPQPVFRRERSLSGLSRERGDLDGVDPRDEKRKRDNHSRRDKPDYSILRLAGEVASTLSQVLPLTGDPLLIPFGIASVLPQSRGLHFLVQVYSTDPGLNYDPAEILNALQRAKPYFRQEVAQDVSRKYAPDFRFQVLPPGVQPH